MDPIDDNTFRRAVEHLLRHPGRSAGNGGSEAKGDYLDHLAALETMLDHPAVTPAVRAQVRSRIHAARLQDER